MLENLTQELVSELKKGTPKERTARELKKIKIENVRSFKNSLAKLSMNFKDKDHFERLLPHILACPDPEISALKLASIGGSADLEKFLRSNPQTGEGLVRLFGSSYFLGNFLSKTPSLLGKIFTGKFLKKRISATEHFKKIAATIPKESSTDEICEALRIYKYSDYIRITYLSVNGLLEFRETTKELTELADALIRVSLGEATRIIRAQKNIEIPENPEFTIVGLGKLGGFELNYSSDIDLFYIYDVSKCPGRTTKAHILYKEYYTRLAELVTKILADRTPTGMLYRVDLRLRPDGDRGQLCQPFASTLRYYEYAGRTWERSIFLRSRFIAGDKNLWDRFYTSMRPFIFKKYLDFGTIEDLKRMKNKINLDASAIKRGTIDIKNGRGGIREIEFFIHTLQLINGGKKPQITSNNTLDSIDKLEANAIIQKDTASTLKDAYTFLRQTEHALQIKDEIQTWKIPPNETELKRLALRGFPNLLHNQDPAKEFSNLLKAKMNEVTKIYDTLFNKRREESPLERKIQTGLFSPATEENIKKYLVELGFKAGGYSLTNFKELKALFPEIRFSARGKSALRQLIPEVILNASQSPDPDQALANFNKFARSVRMHSSYFTLLKENPKALKLITELFGTSQFFSNHLLKHPELLDSLVLGASKIKRETEELKQEIFKNISDTDDSESILNFLRRYNHQEILRIAINEIYGAIDTFGAMAELTSVTDAMVYFCYLASVRETLHKDLSIKNIKKLDGSGKIPFSVIALGKLGNREFTYSSDLDLIFLYDGPEAASKFSKLAQKIISCLSLPTEEGYLYRVDMRLRPSGSQGTLVTSKESFMRYQEQRSRGWEKQALLKARHICGSTSIWEEAKSVIQKFCYKDYDDQTKLDLTNVKKALEKELASEPAGKYNFKSGKGGLLDLEFALHMLALKHGKRFGTHKPMSIKELLLELKRMDIIGEDQFAKLLEGYSFLKRLEHKVRLFKDRPVSYFDAEPDTLLKIAKSLSPEYDGEKVLKLFEDHSQNIRSFYLRITEES